MDIQQKVAARRAELQAAAAAEAAAAAAQEQARKETVLEAVAADLTQSGVPVARDGDVLALAEPDTHLVDLADAKPKAVKLLLAREARRQWTAWDNWLVIGLMVAGLIALIPVFWLGLPMVLISIWRGIVLNARYRRRLIERYPALAVAEAG